MRHVDDGTLHAWLDEELPSAEAALVASHLDACSACRARLEDARAIRDRAAALLDVEAPGVEPPPFDRLVALADARSRSNAGDSPGSRRVLPVRGWLLAAGWAASVALAVGLGWAVRDMTSRAPQPAEMTLASERPASAASERQIEGRAPAPLAGAETTRVPGGGAVEPGMVVAPPAAAAPAAARSAAPARASGEAEPRSDDAARQSLDPLALDRSPAPAADSAPSSPAPAPAPPSRSLAPLRAPFTASPPETGQARGAGAPDTDVIGGSVPVGLRQARGGAGGGGGGRLAADGQGQQADASRMRDEGARAVVWQPVPRTEAAVRIGMALYGIDGLDPIDTAISSDALQARTRYRLASGDVVTLFQQRMPALEFQQRMPALESGVQRGEPPSVAVGPTTAPAALAAPDTGTGPLFRSAGAGTQTWTTVRGDVRMTLEAGGTISLAELGARLRID